MNLPSLTAVKALDHSYYPHIDHHGTQVHSFGVIQNDIKLDHFLLATEKEGYLDDSMRLQPYPRCLPTPSDVSLSPSRLTRSQAIKDGAAAPAPPSATGFPRRRPRFVIIDFVQAECNASSHQIAQV